MINERYKNADITTQTAWRSKEKDGKVVGFSQEMVDQDFDAFLVNAALGTDPSDATRNKINWERSPQPIIPINSGGGRKKRRGSKKRRSSKKRRGSNKRSNRTGSRGKRRGSKRRSRPSTRRRRTRNIRQLRGKKSERTNKRSKHAFGGSTERQSDRFPTGSCRPNCGPSLNSIDRKDYEGKMKQIHGEDMLIISVDDNAWIAEGREPMTVPEMRNVEPQWLWYHAPGQEGDTLTSPRGEWGNTGLNPIVYNNYWGAPNSVKNLEDMIARGEVRKYVKLRPTPPISGKKD